MRAACPICEAGPGADARTRTADPFITSEVLYQLSYVGGRASIARGFLASGGGGGRSDGRRFSR